VMNNPNRKGAGTTAEHAALMAESFRRWTGLELIPELNYGQPELLKEQLYHASIILLSHGTEASPVLNYGNALALKQWEMDWATFTSTPSSETAEPMLQSDRQAFLEQVATKGYVDKYTGVRISSSGRRFYIIDTIVWNLVDAAGQYRGQAAAIANCRYC